MQQPVAIDRMRVDAKFNDKKTMEMTGRFIRALEEESPMPSLAIIQASYALFVTRRNAGASLMEASKTATDLWSAEIRKDAFDAKIGIHQTELTKAQSAKSKDQGAIGTIEGTIQTLTLEKRIFDELGTRGMFPNMAFRCSQEPGLKHVLTELGKITGEKGAARAKIVEQEAFDSLAQGAEPDVIAISVNRNLRILPRIEECSATLTKIEQAKKDAKTALQDAESDGAKAPFEKRLSEVAVIEQIYLGMIRAGKSDQEALKSAQDGNIQAAVRSLNTLLGTLEPFPAQLAEDGFFENMVTRRMNSGQALSGVRSEFADGDADGSQFRSNRGGNGSRGGGGKGTGSSEQSA